MIAKHTFTFALIVSSLFASAQVDLLEAADPASIQVKGYQDTTWNASMAFQIGASYFALNSPTDEIFNPRLHFSARYGYKLLKNPKVFNAAIYLQYTHEEYELASTYVRSDLGQAVYASPTDSELESSLLRLRSISLPFFLILKTPSLKFLNRFQLRIGGSPNFNFQKSVSVYKLNEVEGTTKYKFKEKYDQASFSFTGIVELSFDNLTLFYRHGIATNGQNFNDGRNAIGLGVQF